MSDIKKVGDLFTPESFTTNTENLPALAKENPEQLYRSFLSSPFIAASLPLKDVNKNVFRRKYNNFSLCLASSADKVPYGRYGRLLLTILTTHAVLGANTTTTEDGSVVIKYSSIRQLLKELQLSAGRSNDIKQQLEYFSKSTFVFEEKIETVVQRSLFKDLIDADDELKSDTLQAKLVSSGIIPFMEGMQYVELSDGGKDGKQFCITIRLSPAFVKFSKKHAVPINYTVYKKISSAVGKDIYAWITYRNNSLEKGGSVFIPSHSLVEQFMPVKEDSHENQFRTNYNYIIGQIKEIKEKYYPELNVLINKEGDGITLRKSIAPILPEDERYILVTANV